MEKVILRTSECRCGCNGRDPLHARSVYRKVHNPLPFQGPYLTGAIAPMAYGSIVLQGVAIAVVQDGYQALDGRTVTLGWRKA